MVVCEADSDSLIYRYVASNEMDDRSLLFTHAHNVQTIPRITSVLTEASIPRVAIADIDVIKEPGDVGDLLNSLTAERTRFRDIMDKCNHINISVRENNTDWSEIKENGKDEFPDGVMEEVDEIFEESRLYGLYIVDAGELEGWVDIDRAKGPDWVVDALDEISENGSSDELRGFIQSIRNYLSEQYRDLVEA